MRSFQSPELMKMTHNQAFKFKNERQRDSRNRLTRTSRVNKRANARAIKRARARAIKELVIVQKQNEQCNKKNELC